MPKAKVLCPKCSTSMNHHADKLDYTLDGAEVSAVDPGGSVQEIHTCPNCKNVEVRRAI